MKIHKVLFGLFAGVMALSGGAASAQFYEIGPANIGGQVSSVIVDRQDSSLSTVYAGAISGGLYVRTSNSDVLRNLYANVEDEAYREQLVNNHDSWHLVRYYDAMGYETTLPVSAMVQGPDGTIFVGTGDNTYTLGSTYGKMSSKGRGIYRYIPSTGSFKLIAYTSPLNSEQFGAVRALDYYMRNDTMFFFAATNTGLYRWVVNTAAADIDAEWAQTDVNAILQGSSIDQLVVVRNLNMAYFSVGNQLYRLGDLTTTTPNPINISATNSAFGGQNRAIKLAVAPSDNRYLYAMVIGANGLMENVYLTTNGQSWTALATSSVLPLMYNSGLTCGAMVVDPGNPKRVMLGGTNIWTGEGFLEGANYQWTKNSYSEFELNAGDYMSNVFNTSVFVHSGIQQMVSLFKVVDGEPVTTYYIATDGGIYSTSTEFNSYDNINRGMNNVQITSVAVAPDGSILSGAKDNACPFIEARLAHHGGSRIPAWYDNGELGNMNHDANILWNGDGGKVAASAFQQIEPQLHRNIFVSSSDGNIGRAFNDYMDYTNNQTWTSGVPFLTKEVIGGPQVGSISLWETDNDTYMRDSIKVGLDLKGYFFNANGDTVMITDGNQMVPKNSKAIFMAKNNSDYPFEYVYQKAQRASDSLTVKNPVMSRMLIVAQTGPVQSSVLYSWTVNDFSKVYDSVIDADTHLDPEVKQALREKFMWWAPILNVKRTSSNANLYPRDAVMSTDDRCAYVSTYDDSTHRSQLYRIEGFDRINFHQYPAFTQRQINAASDTSDRVLRNIKFNKGGSEWFNRPISSIAVDPRPGQDRIVVTFEDYSDSYANVLVINNASTNSWTATATPLPITGHVGIPAYCAMIEDSTGFIYVGTADGVFVHNGTSWNQYDHLRGVPVTSIVQQTKKLAVRRTTTHTGITENKYLFAKTKWPRAIYFGTYGRGIFMDMTFVTDTVNEISDSSDYNPVSIPTVNTVGANSVNIYPNPVMNGEANLALTAIEAGNAVLRIYDLNGRMVAERNLGYANEGEQLYTIGTEGMAKGMYLVNVTIGGHTAATKMMVR